jgi:hypothetical protein
MDVGVVCCSGRARPEANIALERVAQWRAQPLGAEIHSWEWRIPSSDLVVAVIELTS